MKVGRDTVVVSNRPQATDFYLRKRHGSPPFLPVKIQAAASSCSPIQMGRVPLLERKHLFSSCLALRADLPKSRERSEHQCASSWFFCPGHYAPVVNVVPRTRDTIDTD